MVTPTAAQATIAAGVQARDGEHLFWQNRAFRVDIVGPGSGNQSQQNLIAMTPALNQTANGRCPAGATYWDIGVRTDDVISGLFLAERC